MTDKTRPNPDFLGDDRVPTILLAGERWPVPPLGLGKNRVIVPKLLQLAPKLFGAMDTAKKAFDLMKFGEAMTEENYGKLADVVYTALTQAHPGLRREEFEMWPVQTSELILAFVVIAQQTGVIKSAKANASAADQGAGAAQPGEAGASTPTSGGGA